MTWEGYGAFTRKQVVVRQGGRRRRKGGERDKKTGKEIFETEYSMRERERERERERKREQERAIKTKTKKRHGDRRKDKWTQSDEDIHTNTENREENK